MVFSFFVAIIKWIAAYFVVLPFCQRAKNKNVMLVSEKGNDARDNGYHFFLYVKQHHPEIEAYYIITDNSPDRVRLTQYSDSIIRYMSFKHCLLFWKARYLVGTHLRAGHTPLPFVAVKWAREKLHIYDHKIVANIKHGITKAAPSGLMGRMVYENTHYDLITCGAEPELKFLIDTYHYPASVAKYTGLCRFDQLGAFQTKRQILVMPTWRKYLNKRNLSDSLYVKSFIALLCDKRLSSLLEEFDVNLIFYPHHEFQSYLSVFFRNDLSKRICIADQAHYDVQQLLKESALMITDYSSVLFDFAYMKKPVLFYQFDRIDYLKRHLSGWYVPESSFGPVCDTEDVLIDTLSGYLQKGMTMDSQYEAFVNQFFPIRDAHNCERVYNALMACV